LKEQLEKAISECVAFPILPDAALELIELANSSAFMFRDMVSIIERDPAIAANVMRVANSAENGRMKQIGSINQAAEILNIKELAELVMKSATASYFSTGIDEGYVYLMRMRDHSVLTGQVARVLAEEMGKGDSSMYYLAGLIHDVGFLVFARAFWNSYSELITHNFNEEKEMWELEQEHFGLTHAEVGGMILERWGLPKIISDGIRFHHNPWDDNSTQEMSTIVHFANFLSHYMLDKSAPFDLKKKIDRFLHSKGADLVETYGFPLTPENFIKLTDKLEEKAGLAN